MEDIDAAFTHGPARDTTDMELENHHCHGSSWEHDCEDEVPRITLSGLLNALDGISAQEGRPLFATANRYHALDPALIRPGRMDLHVEFRLASRYQARELYKCFYIPNNSEGTTAPDEDDDDGDGDDVCTDSAHVTPTKEDSCPNATRTDQCPTR
jgi:mitochondrial chaperone BCS1